MLTHPVSEQVAATLKVLLEAGCKTVTEIGQRGAAAFEPRVRTSALLVAAQHCTAAFPALLGSGSFDLGWQSPVDGTTAMIAAACNQNAEEAVELLRLLMESGADPRQRDHGGSSPLDVARDIGARDVFVFLQEHLAAAGGDESSLAALEARRGPLPLAWPHGDDALDGRALQRLSNERLQYGLALRGMKEAYSLLGSHVYQMQGVRWMLEVHKDLQAGFEFLKRFPAVHPAVISLIARAHGRFRGRDYGRRHGIGKNDADAEPAAAAPDADAGRVPQDGAVIVAQRRVEGLPTGE